MDTHKSPEIYVQGVRDETGGAFPRKEIDDFIQDKVQLNLFLLAYHELMNNDARTDPNIESYALSDMQSFFQIAGIHHIPCTVWNGAKGSALSAALDKLLQKGDWNSGPDKEWGKRTTTGDPNAAVSRTGSVTAWGYCTHGTALFPSWHRCYEVLWEQIVHRKMTEIAIRFKGEWPETAAAARTFRLPFLDPLRPRSKDPAAALGWTSTNVLGSTIWNRSDFTYGLPAIMTKKIVNVEVPEKSTGRPVQKQIDNPLYSYMLPTLAELEHDKTGIKRFTPSEWPKGINQKSPAQLFVEDMRRIPGLKQFERTARCPHTVHGYSQHQILNANFNNVVDAKREKLYQILTLDQSYLHMASSSTIGRINKIYRGLGSAPKYQKCIEAFHDDLHSLLGGRAFGADAIANHGGPLTATAEGHMTDPRTAAFDPVFFLHHNNVERLLCIWQHAWPGRWWKKVKPPDEPDVGLPTKVDDPAHHAANVRAIKEGLFYDSGLDSTMYEADGTWETPSTPLIPFRRPPKPRSRKTWWDTEDIENYEELFGYFYPGIKGDPDPVTMQNRARTLINQQFGWYHANPKLELQSQAIASTVQPIDYGAGWRRDFPAFVDDPTLPPDDTAMAPRVRVAAAIGTPSILSTGALDTTDATPMAMTMAMPSDLPLEAPADMRSVPLRVMSRSKHHAPSEVSRGVDHIQHEAATADLQNVENFSAKAHVNNWTPMPNELSNGKLRIWNFNYVVDRNALQGTFQVNVFVGDFPSDPVSWPSERHLVMSAAIFTSGVPLPDELAAATRPDICPNCVQQAAQKQDYSDFVPLTKMLLDYTRTQERQPPGADGMVLESLEPGHVVPFLKRNLHWRVVGPHGPVDREQTSGLQVTVTSQLTTLPTSMTEFPIYGKEEFHLDITDGRPTGVGFADFPAH